MKKILLVMSKFYPEYSGPGIRIPRLYDAISADINAKDIDVLCNSIEFSQDDLYNHNQYKVRRIVSSYIRKKKFPFNLLPHKLHNLILYNAEVIKSYFILNKYYKDADIVHIIGHSGATVAAILWASKHKKQTILEMVTAHAQPSQKFLHLIKFKPRKENTTIICFDNEAEKRCQSEGYSAQIWKRPNPINEKLFNTDTNDKYTYRKEICLFGEHDKVICTVAKITPQKNQIFLIDVLKQLPENFKLIIAGPIVKSGNLLERDIAYMNDIKARIKAYNLQERVHVISERVDAAKYMRASDIYALPAFNEGFGTPMLEAIACGVPVVANKDEPSFYEWIKDGQNGYLADIEKANEWATAIQNACTFAKNQMQEEALKIISAAGQKSIYRKYMDIINKQTF